MEGKVKKSLRNVIFSVVYKIITLLCPFIIRTIIIYKLGSEYLGINSLFNSILNVLSLSELGIGSAIVFSMYKPVAMKDRKKICALLNLYKKVYHIIGTIITCIGICLMPFLKYLIKGDIPADLNLYILYIIYLFNTSVSYFLYSYKESLFNATQRSDIVNIIKSIVSIFMYVIQIIILLFGGNYYEYIIVLPISTIVINCCQNYKSKKIYPDLVCEGTVEEQDIKEIKKNVFALVGHRIGGTVLYTFDNIVISAFLGLNMVAIYGNYYYIISAILTTMTLVYNSIVSIIGNSIVTESKEKNYDTFLKMSFLNYWISGFCCICFVCLAQHFMKIWVGEKYLFNISTVILLTIYMYVQLVRKINLSFKDAAGMWWNDRFKPYVEAITNLIINIILVNIIGINGVIISSIIATALISMPWELHVLYKCYFKQSEFKYYKKLFVVIIITILIGIVTYIGCSLVTFDGIGGFVVKILICVLIPNILFVLISFKTKEFDEMKKIFKGMLKRHSKQ